MASDTQNSVDTENVIRVMVATDNHLGYGEKDPIRGEDSFTAFEEILQLAVSESVDFILLGGDLFHDAVPSQNALFKCIKLLRQYTFGDKPINIEFLSNQTVNFYNAINQSVNYEDPNLNISIPIFSIHGNHDDPSGFGRLSSLDLLSTGGLVNYFGRWTDLTKIEINPILLRKGETQLALYGLSHIHDARLARLFESDKITIDCPNAEESDEWFHLMVLHQNRADRGPKNYLPEELLPKFLNLVIWGHEHDCRIEPEYNTKQDFYVSQPGSSVPTSLAEGEALKKYVGLLEVYKTKFQMKPLPLQTVRPFVFETVILKELIQELSLDEGDVSNKVKQMAERRINDMIIRAKEMLNGHPKQPTLPLIRLRIIYSKEEQMFNAIRFGQMYNERVANPTDMIHFKKSIQRVKNEGAEFDKDVMDSAFEKMEIDTGTRVEDLVDRYFEEVDETKSLKVISSKVLSEMCFHLVERKDTNAADNIIKFYEEKALDSLMEIMPNEEDIGEHLLHLKTKITKEDILKMLDERGSGNGVNGKERSEISVSAYNEEMTSVPVTKVANSRSKKNASDLNAAPTTSSTRGRGRGRGARGANSTTSTRSNASKSTHNIPPLDVSVTSKRTSTRQKTLLDAVQQNSTTGSRKNPRVYVISDDSDD